MRRRRAPQSLLSLAGALPLPRYSGPQGLTCWLPAQELEPTDGLIPVAVGTHSLQCAKENIMGGRPFIDMTGKTYGRLTALELVDRRKWRFRCECGSEKVIRGDHVRSGLIQSCGCFSDESRRQRPGKRGSSSPRWQGDDITYAGMHCRVEVANGRAAEHSCVDCTAPNGRMEWSWSGCTDALTQVGGNANGCQYCLHIEHYSPRCKGCHEHFDSLKEVCHASYSEARV